MRQILKKPKSLRKQSKKNSFLSLSTKFDFLGKTNSFFGEAKIIMVIQLP